ncbi:MAG: hypothetical protein M1360_03810 [Candidatus Marsarchaeota archaeon]|jgi:hypothetical protein|nr:hypothetical protein [Candidatus Marsarchaeota archaeon]MCL5419038.1 hypothetical protein [Candidatus Marsarchaeota archaeon]
MKKDNIMPIILLAIALLALAAGIAFLNAWLIALCAVSTIIAVVALKSWYVVEALIFSHSGLVEVCNGYELGGSREAAIKREGYAFSATSAALVEGASKPIDRDIIEKIIAKTDFPFKIVMHVKNVRAEKVLGELKTKRAAKELELGRLAGYSKYESRRSALKREIEAINKDIETINSSSPKELIRYVATTAAAQNRIAAEEAAKRQLRELMGDFSAITGSAAKELSGEELLEAIGISA